MHTTTAALPEKRTISGLRWIVPSFADMFFVMVIVWSVLTSEPGWYRVLGDGDIGLHIRVGDWILEHGSLPVQHPFAFSVAGKEWYAFEWLTQVIYSLVHSAWALKGVALFAVLVIAAAFTILFRFMLWRGANAFVAILLTLEALAVNMIHFYARPHAFTWLLLVISLWILQRDRQKPDRVIWALAPITALWANLHGGFVMFLVLLGLLVVGLAAEALFNPDRRAAAIAEAKRYTLVGAVCTAASVINPYGIRLHQHIVDFLGSNWLVDAVDEFKSPTFRSETMTIFMVLLFLGIFVGGLLLQRKQFPDALWILFLGYSSLVSVRHATIYVLVVTPILAVEATRWWRAWVGDSGRATLLGTLDDISTRFGAGATHLSVWPVAFAVWLCLAPNMVWPSDFSAKSFPVEILDKHGPELQGKRVLATDQWSCYLIYRNYPHQQVFFDDQHHYYGKELMEKALKMFRGHRDWERILDGVKFDYVLIASDGPLASLLRLRPDWHVVEEAKGKVLFARDGAGAGQQSARIQ